jgi:hypothetical protein
MFLFTKETCCINTPLPLAKDGTLTSWACCPQLCVCMLLQSKYQVFTVLMHRAEFLMDVGSKSSQRRSRVLRPQQRTSVCGVAGHPKSRSGRTCPRGARSWLEMGSRSHMCFKVASWATCRYAKALMVKESVMRDSFVAVFCPHTSKTAGWGWSRLSLIGIVCILLG